MRLRPSLVALAASLLPAACGGSSQSSTTSASATPASSSQTTIVVATPTSGARVTAATTTTSSTSAPPEVPSSTKERHHRSAEAASQGAHVEAGVAVAASGDLSPPVVSVPSGVRIEIRVANHGTAPRTVALSVPGRPSVTVSPGASKALEAGGQRAGTYSILVDGSARGQLMSGAQGGP